MSDEHITDGGKGGGGGGRLRPDRQRFLIIKPSAMGDVATTLPVICDLKRVYPQADIDWLLHPALMALVAGHDAIHELIPFDRRKLASWWWRPSAFEAFWQLLRRLRMKKYDLVIDAQGLFRSGFLARITGAQIRIGFADAREFASTFYTRRVKLPDGGKKMLAVDRMRALLGPLDISTRGPAVFRVPVQKLALEKVLALLDARGMGGSGGYVSVFPGARWNTKRWPIDRYAQLVQRVLDSGESVVLAGSPDEKPLCDQIEAAIKAAGSRLLNLAEKTDLPMLIALLSRAKLVVGNDSGPLHIAAALGRPVVGLYGPTSPEFVGPFGQLEHVLRHDVPCHPCRRRECGHHSCMNGLPVELVWEKTRGRLEENARTASR